jgi:glycosyltransferase involved in cell wall biosynthesis
MTIPSILPVVNDGINYGMHTLTQNLAQISIITPSFNRVGMIDQAVRSVLQQNYDPLEHIIVDGGSTDGTLDLLAQFHHLTVVSEPDNGMYDALNKGLKLAHGEIIGFLNSDDLYAPFALKGGTAPFANPEVEAVAGRAQIFFESKDGKFENLSEIAPPKPGGLLEQTVLGIPGFNAWFFRRSIFDKIGAFDTEYRFTGDKEFLIRLALAGIVYEQTDSLICQYRRHAGALTYNWNGTFFLEIVQEHLRMADYFLNQSCLPDEARQCLRKLRTRDTINVVISLLNRRAFGNAWYYMREGLRSDWRWPLKFVRRAFNRLTRTSIRKSHLA